MIQYDRITRIFVPQNGGESQAVTLACANLNTALIEIRAWLDLKRRNGRYAHCFIAELTINSFDRLFHIHAIYDEIGKLEGGDKTASRTKKPRQMRPPLVGLWHKHYFQPGFMIRNLIDETERMQKDGRWNAMFEPHHGKFVHEFIGQISREIVDRAYERRAKDRRITGEFIVYERQPDGSNYYLTLGRHGEWAAIRARVDEYKKFDAGDRSPQ